MLDLSVVINTRDHPDTLRLCLAALESQTLSPDRWEIVLVDDGSRDDAALRLAEAYGGKSECRALTCPPSGRAAARNTGIEAAQGRRVLFLGDDILAEPDLLERHLEGHRRHPRAAIIGVSEWDLESPSAAFREWADNLDLRSIRDPQNASFRRFYTGNTSVEREALTGAGGFDENFILYGWEDVELGYRLEKRDLQMVFDPHARAVHHHPRLTLKDLCRREYEIGFSAVYFFGKWSAAPEVQTDRFWTGDPAQAPTGPAWRKTLGRGMIHAAEAFCPIPNWLRALYARLLWSCRHQGLRDGAAHYGPLLEKLRVGKVADGDRDEMKKSTGSTG